MFGKTPRHWEEEKPLRTMRPSDVTRGYIRFFEPDAFVEAEPGIAERAGVASYKDEHSFAKRVVPLSQLVVKSDYKDWADPSIGLSIIDALRDVYKNEQRFQLRPPSEAVLVTGDKTALAEAVFGVYPRGASFSYYRNGYADIYTAIAGPPDVSAWRKVFLEGAETPLRFTRYALETPRTWQDDVVIFVFDPGSALDVIDLWNSRLEPRPIIPVPIEWCSALAGALQKILRTEHRPLRGNTHGVMHCGTVQFARSIEQATRDALLADLAPDLSGGAVIVQTSRNRIWHSESRDDRMPRRGRLEIVGGEESQKLTFGSSDETRASFFPMSPSFAEKFGGSSIRWVNTLNLPHYRSSRHSSTLPFNTFDPKWPSGRSLDDVVLIGREGWSFGIRFKDLPVSVPDFSPEDAMIGSLKRMGAEARLSEPGQIALQILNHLEGLGGVQLLKSRDTLTLLNEMAGGIRRISREGETTEHLFEPRSRSIKDWVDHLAKRAAFRRWPKIALANFIDRNVLRLGVKSECPTCHAANWHGLGVIDYTLTCERCQKPYDFPQAQIQNYNRNWAYRVVGPFAVRDYARGSYGALLALNVLSRANATSSSMTFSTALTLALKGIDAEADYVGWWTRETSGAFRDPELVIGEAKSFGEGELIKKSDVTKLTMLARNFPGSTIVVSVLRDDFTKKEKKLLESLASICRKPDSGGGMANPLVLLTGRELFFDFSLPETWKKLGSPYEQFANYECTRDLRSLAEATQAIHLDLPLWHDQRRLDWEKRRTKLASKRTP